MKILFLDQSGALGGAELCLLDILSDLPTACVAGLFQDGPLRKRLETARIPVKVLSHQPILTRKDSSALQGVAGGVQLLPLVMRAQELTKDCDLIYANTPKALVLGSFVSLLTDVPLVYHLHDIIAPQHFSFVNRTLLVWLANRVAHQVIANSEASRQAFIAAGGKGAKVGVVYNGFRPEDYRVDGRSRDRIRQQLGWENRFIVGHFSRLSPWKGQHVLLEALTRCPREVCALFVGDALFGETHYAQELHAMVNRLQLQERVKFLGFRSDVPPMMAASDLVAHTSTAPEPFGRVVVEAMLCQRPVVAAAAGGVVELIRHQETGWLCPPGDAAALATIIRTCQEDAPTAATIAQRGAHHARRRFHLNHTNQQLYNLLGLGTAAAKALAQV